MSFQPGDEVILAREFTFNGATSEQNHSISTVPIGTRGIIDTDDFDETATTISVRWEGSLWLLVDKACLDHWREVTDEELAEVYRSLGVQKEN